MSGTISVYKILNLWESSTMLFIKLSSKLIFCEKEPTDAEKIEKTLSTMLSRSDDPSATIP
jgi:hypothetical protein